MITPDMKLRSTTPDSSMSFVAKAAAVSAVIVMAFAVPIQFFSSTPVSADDYDAQINAIRRKVEGYEKEANALRSQANTLQNTLNQLATDKAKIQAEIDLYQKQYDKLVKDIKETEEQIAENRRVSGELIVTSSLSGDVPLIVRLAASNNLADYIEGEANLISVRDTIVQKTEETEKLKVELEKKQKEVKKVLDEQKLKRQELASKESEQSRLLAETRGSEAEYKKLIANGRSEIGRLEEAQRQLRNRTVSVGVSIPVNGDGSYPWSGVGYPCWSAGCADPWRLYYRECVSYVAWKLWSTGHRVDGFGGAGHAYQWPGTTGSYTSQRYGDPRPGDAGVLGANQGGAAWTGHVVYVEEKRADGSIRISEYNWNGNGTYGERWLTPSEYSIMTFITFPKR